MQKVIESSETVSSKTDHPPNTAAGASREPSPAAAATPGLGPDLVILNIMTLATTGPLFTALHCVL